MLSLVTEPMTSSGNAPLENKNYVPFFQDIVQWPHSLSLGLWVFVTLNKGRMTIRPNSSAGPDLMTSYFPSP